MRLLTKMAVYTKMSAEMLMKVEVSVQNAPEGACESARGRFDSAHWSVFTCPIFMILCSVSCPAQDVFKIFVEDYLF